MARFPRYADLLDGYIDELGDSLPNGKLRCHCGTFARPTVIKAAATLAEDGIPGALGAPDPEGYSIHAVRCAGCAADTVFACSWKDSSVGRQRAWIHQVHPLGRAVRQFTSPATARFVVDYVRACMLADICPEASATMSRRCLQAVLVDQGYTQYNPKDQISSLLAENDPDRTVPRHVRRQIDVIRGFGNFGAHVPTNLKTLEILPVEPGEAEWCIELVESLLEFYYEVPYLTDQKLDAAKQKLESGGKFKLQT